MDTIFYKIQKHSRLLKISVIAALLFAYCFLPLYACAAPDENIKTTSYNVNVNVNKDKTFDITEHITVDFSEGSIGIIREIPARVEAVFETRGGEVRQDVRLKIKVKSVSGGPYSLFESDEGVSIRTGDPEIYLSGRHEYVINYRIEPFEGDIGSDDGIFLDLIPQSWKYGIESARVIVTFPNDVDIKDFGFVGIEGGLVDTDLMSVERLWPDAVGAYTLDATSKRPLRHGEGVAFRAIAPYGFFQGGGSTQAGEAGFPVGGVRFPVSGALFWIAVAAAPFACLLLWFAYGMDERIEETTEYYPPDGLLPAEVGLLMDGRLQDRELLSMVFYWANQGCLKIEETGRQDLTLHKVCDLPAGAKQFEKSLFESIFADGDQASLKSSARQIGRGLLKAKHLLIADFGNNTIKNLYDKQSLDMRTVAFLISLLPVIFNFIYALDAGPFESVAGAGLPEAPKLSEVDNYGVTMVTPLGFFVLFIALCMIRYAGYAMVHSEEVAEKSNELAERAD
ncbi:MAG: DUF2207 domain-containing protein, partial [Clostridiales bacterium]|nr:DUF2207 domain-containing protein [Clostridiales bacterium]